MSGVSIKQFGGHSGSFAGDCAVVTIDAGGRRDVLIIDTGASKVWKTKTELTRYIKAQLPDIALKAITLVTTHFHEDHYNEGNIPALEVKNHVFSQQAAANCGFTPVSSRTNMALGAGVHEFRGEDTGCIVRFYVPPGGRSDDQNDQSMAVYVACEKFSFLSFGDMTKDAYLRLVGHVGPLPRATVTKYPHHGNYPNNFLDYYNASLFSTAVLISGNSGSDVNTTIDMLRSQNVGAVYCLSRTREADELFMRWTTIDTPVYVCGDVVIGEGGVSMESGQYLTSVTEQVTSRRSITSNRWEKVQQDWSAMDTD